MAATPQIPDFDAAGFREGIRLAMTVGLPTETAAQPVFFMPTEFTPTAYTDQEGVPLNPAYRPTAPTPTTKTGVDCAIEYVDSAGKIESFGVLVPSKVILTLLDEEYEQVKGFSYVAIGGTKYFYRSTETPLGLVSVGIWRVHCVADDEG